VAGDGDPRQVDVTRENIDRFDVDIEQRQRQQRYLRAIGYREVAQARGAGDGEPLRLTGCADEVQAQVGVERPGRDVECERRGHVAEIAPDRQAVERKLQRTLERVEEGYRFTLQFDVSAVDARRERRGDLHRDPRRQVGQEGDAEADRGNRVPGILDAVVDVDFAAGQLDVVEREVRLAFAPGLLCQRFEDVREVEPATRQPYDLQPGCVQPERTDDRGQVPE
jgi:hypothetical protein